MQIFRRSAPAVAEDSPSEQEDEVDVVMVGA